MLVVKELTIPCRPEKPGFCALSERLCQRAVPQVRFFTGTVALKQPAGTLGQLPPDFAPFAFDPGDPHMVVGGGPVPHPGDDGRFGPAFKRNPLRPRHGSAADRNGVFRHGGGELRLEAGPAFGEMQIGGHRIPEFDRIRGLFCFAAAFVRLKPALPGRVPAFEFEFSADRRSPSGGGPEPDGLDAVAPPVNHDPAFTGHFQAAGQPRVPARNEFPAFGESYAFPVVQKTVPPRIPPDGVFFFFHDLSVTPPDFSRRGR